MFVKTDSFNLFLLMEQKFVLHAQVNAKNVLKVQENAVIVMLQLTEFKVTTH